MPLNRYINYTTVAGDSFDALALKFYYEEKLAHHIMGANPDFCGVLIFSDGAKLKIPVLDKPETPETLPPWRRGK
jgi:hypothetical protein